MFPLSISVWLITILVADTNENARGDVRIGRYDIAELDGHVRKMRVDFSGFRRLDC